VLFSNSLFGGNMRATLPAIAMSTCTASSSPEIGTVGFALPLDAA
jgi:hypothetical protein